MTLLRTGWLRRLVLGVLFLLTLAELSPAWADASDSRNSVRLANGTLLVLEQRSEWRSAAVCLLLNTPEGARPGDQTILINLADQVIASGFQSGLPEMLGGAEFLDFGLRFQRRGEAILLTVEVPPADLERGAELLAGMLDFNPLLPELASHIERMRQRLYAGGFNTDEGELARLLALGKRPTPIPLENPLRFLPTPEELLAFLQSLRRPGNVTVSVCAPHLPEATFSFFARLFGSRPPEILSPFPATGSSASETATLGPSPGQNVYRLPGKGPLVRIAFAFALPCTARTQYWATRALALILTGPRFSRLYQSLRRREGLAYGLEARVELSGDRAVLLVQCLLPRQASKRGESLLLAEVEKLAGLGASDEECRRAKEYLKGLVTTHRQRPVEAARENAEEATLGNAEIDTPPSEVIDSLTGKEINWAAQRAKVNWAMWVYG